MLIMTFSLSSCCRSIFKYWF